jgi:hypothetical protein
MSGPNARFVRRAHIIHSIIDAAIGAIRYCQPYDDVCRARTEFRNLSNEVARYLDKKSRPISPEKTQRIIMEYERIRNELEIAILERVTRHPLAGDQ